MTRFKIEYKWLVGIVYIMALFMDLLDMTVTNVAIPTLAKRFTASTTTIEWVITGYLLSLAMFIPISGWLGDRFGTKRVFVFALTTFTAASLLCGLAWNVESLIAFRVFQGVGGGMLTPVGMTMLFRAFPPAERASASAVLAIPAMVAPALGPILGGYLVDYQSWRSIFFIPLFLQTQKGLSPFSTGLLTFPLAIGVALTAQPAAKLYPSIGPRKMMLFAFTGNMALTASLALVGYGTSDWLIVANMFV